jgi:hypothetical protein
MQVTKRNKLKKCTFFTKITEITLISKTSQNLSSLSPPCGNGNDID